VTIRTPFIAGNWKLNHGPEEARRFFRAFLSKLDGVAGTVAFFPPSLSLAAAAESLGRHTEVLLGVQNVFWETSGAFTGEISAPMAKEAGASLVLVGHSERRHVFGETTEDTVRKVRAVLDAGLVAVLCVGELLEEREAGAAEDVVRGQLEAVTMMVSPGEVSRFVVAYEPVWAIGTGRTASPTDAAEMHGQIRTFLQTRFGAAAAAIPILYGGSVKPENAGELLASPGVGGLLVGGASLDADAFASICASKP
jgi:triosephosphate isomerase (TIM)